MKGSNVLLHTIQLSEEKKVFSDATISFSPLNHQKASPPPPMWGN